MNTDWEEWDGDKSTPYADFLNAIDAFGVDRTEGEDAFTFVPLFLPGYDNLKIRGGLPDDYPRPWPDLEGKYGKAFVPVPEHTENTEFRPEEWLPDPNSLPCLAKDSVIAGVIDRGIPLGHDRHRLASGGSRILSAWQQGSPRVPPFGEGPTPPGTVPSIPFGTELYQSDIDELLRQYSVTSGSTERLDEISFNRASGSVDAFRYRAPRQLAGRTSHGAQVLDLAAGHERFESTTTFADKVRVLAATLPDRATVHASGAFLDYFVLFAIYRIVLLADMIWLKSGLPAPEKAKDPVGYPTVINLAFGVQAGGKKATSFFDSIVNKLQRDRRRLGFRPFDLVIPVGNDNLSRSRAVMQVPARECGALTLRLKPEDQSSNFVEVRTRVSMKNKNDPVPLRIAVRPPGSLDQATAGYDGHRRDIVDNTQREIPMGRIYCALDQPVSDEAELFYLVCLAPSLRQDRPADTAPSGLWEIFLESDEDLEVTLAIQSDQSFRVGGSTGLRAYFDDSCYEERRFTEKGEVRDSYSYGLDQNDRPIHPQNLDFGSPVERHGTINDTAIEADHIAPAGYRRRDGKPSLFSSTGRRDVSAVPRDNPTVALPTEDSAALFGTLGAGAANGSVVAMLGTSFASALATRYAVTALLEQSRDGYGTDAPSAKAALVSLATADEDKKGDPSLGICFVAHADRKKIGKGRMAVPGVTRMPRLGPPESTRCRKAT